MNTAAAESTLGWIYYLEGRITEACPLLRHALASDEATYGPKTGITAQVGTRLGDLR